MGRSNSVRNANLLYLIAFLALLGGSLLLSGTSLGWRVVINELVFLGLPLVLYLILTRADLPETLRLRGVSWQIAGLSLLIGLGLWRFDSWVGAVISGLLGYTIPLPPEALNLTLMDKLAMAVGTVVLAPLLEELLFRGVLLSAYERRGPLRAIVASSLLFVIIHQELAQTFAIVPVSLALGYVSWRTGSIIPAILVHFGNNAQAMIISFLEAGGVRRMAFTPSTTGALIGGAVALVALWLLRQLTSPPDREEAPGDRRSERGWLGRIWPVIPVVPIYLAVIAIGVVFGVRPEVLAFGQPVELGSPPWEGARRWSYEIRNALDEAVGEAECSLTPESASFLLDCSMEQSAYEVDAPSGFFSEGSATQRQRVRWDRETLALVEASIELTFSQGPEEVDLTATVGDGQMTVQADGATDGAQRFDGCYELPPTGRAGDSLPTEAPCRTADAFVAGGGVFSPLMAGEWPWRFSALPFEVAYSREATLVWPYRSTEGIDGRAPAKQERAAVVRTAEQISTPAGEFVTWRVTVGEKATAWYAVEPPYDLVAFDDGMVTWRLTAVD